MCNYQETTIFIIILKFHVSSTLYLNTHWKTFFNVHLKIHFNNISRINMTLDHTQFNMYAVWIPWHEINLLNVNRLHVFISSNCIEKLIISVPTKMINLVDKTVIQWFLKLNARYTNRINLCDSREIPNDLIAIHWSAQIEFFYNIGTYLPINE